MVLGSGLLSFNDAAAINVTNFPTQVGEMLGIGVFAGGVLCTLMFICMWLIPLNMFVKSNRVIPNLLVGLCVVSFCVAVGWVHYFIFLFLFLVISALYAGKIRDWVSGGGQND